MTRNSESNHAEELRADIRNGRYWKKDNVIKWLEAVKADPALIEGVHVHVTLKNSKLEAFMVSTMAGEPDEDNLHLGTCRDDMCIACQKACYAKKAQKLYPTKLLANGENTLLFALDPDRAIMELRDALDKYVKRCRKKGIKPYCRWHESGEFYGNDDRILDALSKYAAEVYPEVKFYGYTKVKTAYCEFYNSTNANILWSPWEGNKIPDEVTNCGQLKAYFVQNPNGTNEHIPEEVKKHHRKCPGLVKGKFACNLCNFACAEPQCMIADLH
jgi:hypothetical protein